MNVFNRTFVLIVIIFFSITSLELVFAGELIVYSDQGIEKIFFPDYTPAGTADEHWELKSIECIYNCNKEKTNAPELDRGNVKEENPDTNSAVNMYVSVYTMQPAPVTYLWPLFYSSEKIQGNPFLRRNMHGDKFSHYYPPNYPNKLYGVPKGFDRNYWNSMNYQTWGYRQSFIRSNIINLGGK